MNELQTYYQQRAKEYELIYQKTERQADLKKLHAYLRQSFDKQQVLEIACGTGYWTQTLAQTCAAIRATDINSAVLEIAQVKDYGTTHIQLEQVDFWELAIPTNLYDSVFGGFIWSHILKKDLPAFLELLSTQISNKGSLVFVDNKYVKGSSTPIAKTDADGNTYQVRWLENGETYEVLKNFPSETEVLELIKGLPLEMEWVELKYYWVLKLQLIKTKRV